MEVKMGYKNYMDAWYELQKYKGRTKARIRYNYDTFEHEIIEEEQEANKDG